jgi:hypothetical protein
LTTGEEWGCAVRPVDGEPSETGSETVSEDPQDKQFLEETPDDVEAHSAQTDEKVYPEPQTDDEPDDSDPDFELHGSWGGIG